MDEEDPYQGLTISEHYEGNSAPETKESGGPTAGPLEILGTIILLIVCAGLAVASMCGGIQIF
ncbi:MAG: hypothetical protein AAB874_05170 [Patescibacteria group bacterium]